MRYFFLKKKKTIIVLLKNFFFLLLLYFLKWTTNTIRTFLITHLCVCVFVLYFSSLKRKQAITYLESSQDIHFKEEFTLFFLTVFFFFALQEPQSDRESERERETERERQHFYFLFFLSHFHVRTANVGRITTNEKKLSNRPSRGR